MDTREYVLLYQLGQASWRVRRSTEPTSAVQSRLAFTTTSVALCVSTALNTCRQGFGIYRARQDAYRTSYQVEVVPLFYMSIVQKEERPVLYSYPYAQTLGVRIHCVIHPIITKICPRVLYQRATSLPSMYQCLVLDTSMLAWPSDTLRNLTQSCWHRLH